MISKVGDGNLDSIFKRNNGIWIGKNFDSQDLFEVNNLYGSNVTLTNSNITIIKNGNTDYIKFM